ncbi:MAG: hypothetical protein FWG87_10655 [Defluviitaleaceae bacterium]|nr:hypothetical protein [Defluviitaleaceae bacterium]
MFGLHVLASCVCRGIFARTNPRKSVEIRRIRVWFACFGFVCLSWACRVFVGDGFIRPEIISRCVNGRYPSPN